MRLVLDTNVVISGLIWGGTPRQLLNLARDDQVQLFTSSLLLNELADVLRREKFATLLASQQITPDFLIQHYGILAPLVKPEPIEPTVTQDPDDDAVIATALAAQADAIVTGDTDLLVLHPWRGIRILNPGIAIRLVIEGST